MENQNHFIIVNTMILCITRSYPLPKFFNIMSCLLVGDSYSSQNPQEELLVPNNEEMEAKRG